MTTYPTQTTSQLDKTLCLSDTGVGATPPPHKDYVTRSSPSTSYSLLLTVPQIFLYAYHNHLINSKNQGKPTKSIEHIMPLITTTMTPYISHLEATECKPLQGSGEASSPTKKICYSTLIVNVLLFVAYYSPLIFLIPTSTTK